LQTVHKRLLRDLCSLISESDTKPFVISNFAVLEALKAEKVAMQ